MSSSVRCAEKVPSEPGQPISAPSTSPNAPGTAALYDRHGYEAAIRTQILHGILEYCGTREGATAFVFESEALEDDESVAAAVRSVSESVGGTRAPARRR